MRVPLVVCLPGEPARAVARSAHVDVLPTLAAIAEARLNTAVAAQVEGRSLLPLLKDPGAEWPDRTLFTHVGRWPRGTDPQEYKYRQCSIRTPRWHLVCTADDGRKAWQLFDLAADPGEKTDVAAAHPGVVRDLDAAYDAWWASVQPQLVNENAVAPAVNPFKELFEKQFGPAAAK